MHSTLRLYGDPGRTAQEKENSMTVYIIIDCKVKDPQKYREYQEKVPDIIARHGGRYLARGNRITPISGNWEPERMVLLSFPDQQHVRDWLSSPEYQAIAPLRKAGADTSAVLVEADVG
jgi:uncharacterized protein (DUF1330 family)